MASCSLVSGNSLAVFSRIKGPKNGLSSSFSGLEFSSPRWRLATAEFRKQQASERKAQKAVVSQRTLLIQQALTPERGQEEIKVGVEPVERSSCNLNVRDHIELK